MAETLQDLMQTKALLQPPLSDDVGDQGVRILMDWLDNYPELADTILGAVGDDEEDAEENDDHEDEEDNPDEEGEFEELEEDERLRRRQVLDVVPVRDREDGGVTGLRDGRVASAIPAPQTTFDVDVPHTWKSKVREELPPAKAVARPWPRMM